FMWKVKHNDLFHLMIPCGISSTIFGLVYGSLFGYEEALDPLYHALGMAGKPVSVMDSITGILMVAVYIGIVLVLAAMVLNMYTHARHREWGEFIFSPNGLVGMVTYLCGVDLASAYMGAVTFMPQVLAVVGMVVGLVLLLFAELLAPMVEGKPWKPAGGMGNYLMQSVFELLETVLSYLSNTISFLRVGAFVIVHASMMMVVFTLAGTPNNIVVVILGNLVVICLEALLSAIPIPRVGIERQRIILKGDVPSPVNLPDGCRFAGRCPYAQERCFKETPELREVAPGRFVACHLA
ncbi:MAG: hypothetical protein JJO44_21625, partial [Escherichia coli]|nr:hypothetical protein [Escherichia coli]